MNLFWQSGQIKNADAMAPVVLPSNSTETGPIGLGLSQYMHRKNILSMRSMVSFITRAARFLLNPKQRLLLPQTCINSHLIGNNEGLS